MNRLGEILKEITQLSTDKGNLTNALKDVNNRIIELTIEWQDLCNHPEEYRDVEVSEDGDKPICRACNKILEVEE